MTSDHKLAVVGSRDFPHLWMVTTYLSDYVREHGDIEIVSGGAKGVDQQAEHFGWNHTITPPTIFLPDWELLGKRAGFVRNQQIVDYATAVVAFHYGDSRGTAHTIKLAREAGKLREVIHVY